MPITIEKAQVTMPSDREVKVMRSFRAPRALVYKAYTEPALVRQWMLGPPGWSMPVCEMDVRVGGDYRWEWKGPDGAMALAIWGTHREVNRPANLVHTERMEIGPGAGAGDCAQGEPWELLATIELTEREGRTHLRMTLLFPSKEARDMALQSGMEIGVDAGYTVLDNLVSSR